jgi:hypothetical protein
MAYLSHCFRYQEWGLRDLSRSIEEAGASTPNDRLSIVTRGLVQRVAALFFASVAIFINTVTFLPDMLMLNIRAISEYGPLSFSVAKVNFAFCKVLFRGTASLLGAIVAPYYVFHTLAAYKVLSKDISEVLTLIPQNLEVLADSLNADFSLLENTDENLGNWRQELADIFSERLVISHDFAVDPHHDPDFTNFHLEIFRDAFRKVLENHYPRHLVTEALPQRYNLVGAVVNNFQNAPEVASPELQDLLVQLGQYQRGERIDTIFSDPGRRMQALRMLVDSIIERFPALQRHVTELDRAFHSLLIDVLTETKIELIADGSYTEDVLNEFDGTSLAAVLDRSMLKIILERMYVNQEENIVISHEPEDIVLDKKHSIEDLYDRLIEAHASISTLMPDEIAELKLLLLHKEGDASEKEKVRKAFRAIGKLSGGGSVIQRKVLTAPIRPSFWSIFSPSTPGA